jgi:HPt (histidine-containing phosphotransfer) domain-containing protein
MNQPPTPVTPRRRYRAADVTEHLDMGVIGEVCLGVSLLGYQSILQGFFKDESGNRARLLAALDQARTAELTDLAHALKGAAASLGLRSVRELAAHLEAMGTQADAPACQWAAQQLRERLDTAQGLLTRMGFA